MVGVLKAGGLLWLWYAEMPERGGTNGCPCVVEVSTQMSLRFRNSSGVTCESKGARGSEVRTYRILRQFHRAQRRRLGWQRLPKRPDIEALNHQRVKFAHRDTSDVRTNDAIALVFLFATYTPGPRPRVPPQEIDYGS